MHHDPYSAERTRRIQGLVPVPSPSFEGIVEAPSMVGCVLAVLDLKSVTELIEPVRPMCDAPVLPVIERVLHCHTNETRSWTEEATDTHKQPRSHQYVRYPGGQSLP